MGLTLASTLKLSGWLRLGVIRLVHNVGSRGEDNLALQRSLLQATDGSFVQIDLVWVSKPFCKPRELKSRRLIAFINPIRENLERGSQKFFTRLRDIMGWPCSLYVYWDLHAFSVGLLRSPIVRSCRNVGQLVSRLLQGIFFHPRRLWACTTIRGGRCPSITYLRHVRPVAPPCIVSGEIPSPLTARSPRYHSSLKILIINGIFFVLEMACMTCMFLVDTIHFERKIPFFRNKIGFLLIELDFPAMQTPPGLSGCFATSGAVKYSKAMWWVCESDSRRTFCNHEL